MKSSSSSTTFPQRKVNQSIRIELDDDGGVQDWCDNAIHNRARVAQEEIVAALVAHCNEKGIAIETGVDKQVAQAYTLKVVDTLKNVSDKNSSLTLNNN